MTDPVRMSMIKPENLVKIGLVVTFWGSVPFFAVFVLKVTIFHLVNSGVTDPHRTEFLQCRQIITI